MTNVTNVTNVTKVTYDRVGKRVRGLNRKPAHSDNLL